MKDQRRFAPEGGRIESESVAGFIGISIYTINIAFYLQEKEHLIEFYQIY